MKIATDTSIFEIKPKDVIYPNNEELMAIIKNAKN